METTTTAAITLYRWECFEHRQNGRWLGDPNAAGDYGYRHWDRLGGEYEGGTCQPRIVDNHGNDHGPAV